MPVSFTTAALSDGSYVLDVAATTLRFETRHWFGLGAVRGSFDVSSASVEIDDGRVTVDVTVAAASFASGNDGRDRKVRSATFLDTADHPEIRFHADEEIGGDGAAAVAGTVTVRGRQAPVTVEGIDVRPDGDGILVEATATVDRYALGVTAMRGVAARTLHLTIAARFVTT